MEILEQQRPVLANPLRLIRMRVWYAITRRVQRILRFRVPIVDVVAEDLAVLLAVRGVVRHGEELYDVVSVGKAGSRRIEVLYGAFCTRKAVIVSFICSTGSAAYIGVIAVG